MLDTLGNMVESFLGKAGTKRVFSANAARIKAVVECVETVRFVHSPCLLIFSACISKLELKLDLDLWFLHCRCLVSVYHRKCSLLENVQLVKFLLRIVSSSHAELYSLLHSSGNQRYTPEIGKRMPSYNSLWEVQTIAFTMIAAVFSRDGSSLPGDVWQSTMEVSI